MTQGKKRRARRVPGGFYAWEHAIKPTRGAVKAMPRAMYETELSGKLQLRGPSTKQGKKAA
jgi:hypothetical protein